LGLDAFREIGPGGHFLGCSHTQANFETAFHRFDLHDSNSVEQWEAEGSKDMAVRANARWKAMLASYEAPALDQGIDEALQAFIARRKSEMPDASY
ncbi:MAG: trimethylamine methyltransferase family protein, partial [Pseudomonadota bacterium]